MCSSSRTRQNEQKPTASPARRPRDVTKRNAVVFELRQVHLARPRVRERRPLDFEHLVDPGRRRQQLNAPCHRRGRPPAMRGGAAPRHARVRRRAAARRAAGYRLEGCRPGPGCDRSPASRLRRQAQGRPTISAPADCTCRAVQVGAVAGELTAREPTTGRQRPESRRAGRRRRRRARPAAPR